MKDSGAFVLQEPLRFLQFVHVLGMWSRLGASGANCVFLCLITNPSTKLMRKSCNCLPAAKQGPRSKHHMCRCVCNVMHTGCEPGCEGPRLRTARSAATKDTPCGKLSPRGRLYHCCCVAAISWALHASCAMLPPCARSRGDMWLEPPGTYRRSGWQALAPYGLQDGCVPCPCARFALWVTKGGSRRAGARRRGATTFPHTRPSLATQRTLDGAYMRLNGRFVVPVGCCCLCNCVCIKCRGSPPAALGPWPRHLEEPGEALIRRLGPFSTRSVVICRSVERCMSRGNPPPHQTQAFKALNVVKLPWGLAWPCTACHGA